MDKKSLLFGLAGLLAGIGTAWATAAISVNNNNTAIMQAMGIRTTASVQLSARDHDDMTMGEMVRGLESKSGDDFDKLFLSEMIVHHQGAVDMAKMADGSAKHNELKKLAKHIITDQTAEIEQMKTYQNEWNYLTDSHATINTHTTKNK